MDIAFVQRFDIKVFIGLPNTESREKWLEMMISRLSASFN